MYGITINVRKRSPLTLSVTTAFGFLSTAYILLAYSQFLLLPKTEDDKSQTNEKAKLDIK